MRSPVLGFFSMLIFLSWTSGAVFCGGCNGITPSPTSKLKVLSAAPFNASCCGLEILQGSHFIWPPAYTRTSAEIVHPRQSIPSSCWERCPPTLPPMSFGPKTLGTVGSLPDQTIPPGIECGVDGCGDVWEEACTVVEVWTAGIGSRMTREPYGETGRKFHFSFGSLRRK